MSSATDQTLRQKAYSIIQIKLLDGEIRAGDLVSELALAESIGMSRTPVREAIGQLESEGLFDKVPRVGTLVRLPTQRELSELYGVREALESCAASIAANELTQAQLAHMESCQSDLVALIEESRQLKLEALHDAFLRRFFEADITFHSLIVGAMNNERTLKIIGEFRVVQRVYEYGRMSYNIDFVESAMHEHGQILEALQSHDSEKARLAMAAHIRSSGEHAMDRFTDANPVPIPVSGASGYSRLKQRPRHRSTASAE